MKLGFFTMPMHPPGRNYTQTLKEDREAVMVADKFGFCEAFIGEHSTDICDLGGRCAVPAQWTVLDIFKRDLKLPDAAVTLDYVLYGNRARSRRRRSCRPRAGGDPVKFPPSGSVSI